MFSICPPSAPGQLDRGQGGKGDSLAPRPILRVCVPLCLVLVMYSVPSQEWDHGTPSPRPGPRHWLLISVLPSHHAHCPCQIKSVSGRGMDGCVVPPQLRTTSESRGLKPGSPGNPVSPAFPCLAAPPARWGFAARTLRGLHWYLKRNTAAPAGTVPLVLASRRVSSAKGGKEGGWTGINQPPSCGKGGRERRC